jgi:hypothetical protein
MKEASMPLAIAVGVVILLSSFAALFAAAALAIRRDLNRRFDRVRVQLEQHATAVMHDLLDTR